MTISHGKTTKNITLYPPTKPSHDSKDPPCIEESDE
jgi:hypothetical protein